jgi:hypothetical protein
MGVILRVVWIIKLIPLTFFVSGPVICMQLIWCAVGWLCTGRDSILGDNTPMGWLTSGWRWKVMMWPLGESK